MRVIIVGGGIGGLTLGLMLQKAGIHCSVREAVADLQPLGVGINTLPHSIRELAALDLLPALDQVAIRTRRLTYANHLGQEIWSEPRGLFGGHGAPQFSIHRGRLQLLLWKALAERVAPEDLRKGCKFVRFEQDAERVRAWFQTPDGSMLEEEGDVLVGADGIHSTMRALLHPDALGVRWNGITMWRGAVQWPLFDGGDTMVIAGNARSKLVLYPIGPGKDESSRLTNWVVYTRTDEASTSAPPRESWSKRGTLRDVEPLLEGFDLPYVDVHRMIEATTDVFEYPMCDKDPLPWWTQGRVTLLGDAAHPMYPVGSNGSAQAVLDARCLTGLLAEMGAVEALRAYEGERLPKTAAIVESNRKGGPEAVIDLAAARAPHGFKAITDVASKEEIDAIASGYARLAGFAKEPSRRVASGP